MAASADISEVEVQVKHTQCLTGRAFILSKRTRYEDAGVDLLVTASVWAEHTIFGLAAVNFHYHAVNLFAVKLPCICFLK